MDKKAVDEILKIANDIELSAWRNGWNDAIKISLMAIGAAIGSYNVGDRPQSPPVSLLRLEQRIRSYLKDSKNE